MYSVYQIICDETKFKPYLTYYGSTKCSLEERFKRHVDAKRMYEKYKMEGHPNWKSYSFSSRQILEMSNPRIVRIDDMLTKEEALHMESELIENNPCVNEILSKFIADTRVGQYHRDKVTRPELHQKRLESFKEYRTKNKSVINAKLSRKIECPLGCGSTFQYRNLSQHKKSCKKFKEMKE